MHLINIRRVACGITELSDIREKYHVPKPEQSMVSDTRVMPAVSEKGGLTAEDVEAITRAVLAKLRG